MPKIPQVPNAPGPAQAGTAANAPAASAASQVARGNAAMDALPPSAVDSSSPEAFIRGIAPYAMRVSHSTGIPAEVLIGMAANETGFGKYAHGNNLFGIKGTGPAGSFNSQTWEDYGAGAVTIQDNFRAYNSPAESLLDFAKLVMTSPRYAGAMGQMSVEGFVGELRRGGYMTDPDYVQKIKNITTRYSGVIHESLGDSGSVAPATAAMASVASVASSASPNASRMGRGVIVPDQFGVGLPTDEAYAACYDAETRVLTRRGFVYFRDLTDEDELATRREDGVIEYHQPLARQRFHYRGRMCHFKTPSVDLLVTADHQMLALATGRRYLRGGKVEARAELVPAERIASSAHGWSIPVQARWTGAGQVASAGRRRAAVAGAVGPRTAPMSAGLTLPVGMPTRFIPRAMLQADPEDLNALLRCLRLGDGSNDGPAVYTTSSKQLAEDVAELGVKLGFGAAIRRRRPTRNPIWLAQYDVSLRSTEYYSVHSKLGSVSMIDDWEGEVFCATVPNHTLLVERNGNITWCGNCGPMAAIAFSQAYGRTPSVQEAMALAKQSGWTAGGGMNGVANEKRLLDKLGIPAQLETSVNWEHIKADALNRNPVVLSTPGHYFVIDGYDQRTGAYHVGQSGKALRAGSEWMTAAQITQLEGAPSGALYTQNPLSQQTAAAIVATPAPAPLVSSAPAPPPVQPAVKPVVSAAPPPPVPKGVASLPIVKPFAAPVEKVTAPPPTPPPVVKIPPPVVAPATKIEPVAPAPAKAVAEPVKAASEPVKAVAEPVKPAPEPVKPAAETVKPAAEPPPVRVITSRVTAQPRTLPPPPPQAPTPAPQPPTQPTEQQVEAKPAVVANADTPVGDQTIAFQPPSAGALALGSVAAQSTPKPSDPNVVPPRRRKPDDDG